MRKLFLGVVIFTLMLPVWSSSQPAIAQEEGTVIAEGLNGPQGVLIDESGTVWVIDSGVGGDEEVPFLNPQTGEESPAQYGESAQIVKISPDGTQTTVVNLPSIVTPSDTIGGARLAVLDGEVYATVGQWLGDPSVEAGVPNAGIVAKISDDSIETVASTWDFERSENPDGLIADSHPYGLAASPNGDLWVTDAGANTLLSINPLTGRTTLVAVFEGVPSPLPSAARNNELLTDAVPTSVVAKDDMIFVSLLPGFPFVPGSAKVVTVAADGTVSDYATNLTMLTDLQLGPDNELYAVQFAVFGEQGPTPNSGALIRIVEGDASEVVLEGLSFPTSVSFDSAGDAYLAINGVGAPGSGQVVMYADIATGAGEVAEESAETAEAAVTEAMTDTVTMTDTMAMTDTAEMTETMEMTSSEEMTDTAEMTDAAAMTETMEMAGTEEMTDTAEMTEAAAMTETMEMTSTEEMTDAENMSDAMAMTETMTMTETAEAAVAEPAATEEAVEEDVEEDVEEAVEAAPTEMTSAPESMPTTGAGDNISQTTLPIVMLILAALAVGAYATRRREA